MKKTAPNEPNFDDILPLLGALDEGLLHTLQGQALPIIVVTAVPAASRFEDIGNESGHSDEDELEDAEGCCPEYEPSGDGTGRCAYACPECGICLRQYIGEEFE